MKNILFFILLSFSFLSLSAQNQYTINGKNHELKTAVEGELDLLWNVTNKHFKYFVKTLNGQITELLNTKSPNNKYQQEYKTQLSELTKNANISTDNLKFTLTDLTHFIKHYNTAIGDSAYLDEKPMLKTRLGFYGGITNHPFVNNPNNSTVPFFGTELEIIPSKNNSRHAGFFSIEHALKSNDFKYATTQLALGYRYRFIKKSAFNIYGNMLLATYNFSKSTIEITNTNTTIETETVKNSTFKMPFAFGLGADIKISEQGFITLAYNELFAVFVENNSNFPVDFAVGYKFNL